MHRSESRVANVAFIAVDRHPDLDADVDADVFRGRLEQAGGAAFPSRLPLALQPVLNA